MTSSGTASGSPIPPPTGPHVGSGRRRVPVARLWVAVLCGYLAFGATLQALPVQVPARFGGGEVATGWAVGIAFAATALCRPWAGRIGDAGHSRPIVLTGGILIACGGVGHLLAPSLWVLLLARIVMGAGEAALFSAALPWVVTGTPVERRGRVAGWFGLSMWGGLAAGPLLAVAAGTMGDAAVWWAVLALGVAAAVLVALTGPADQPRAIPLLPRHRRDVLPHGAALPGLAFGLSATGYGTVTTLLVLYLIPAGHAAAGAALAVFATAFLVARTVGSPAVDRYGGAAVAGVSLIVEAVGLGLIALSPHPALSLTGTALAGVGVSLMFPATVAMTLARSTATGPGTSVGTMTSFWDLGILVAGPTSGAVAARTAASTAFAVAALASLAAVAVVILVVRGARPGGSLDGPGR